MAEIVYESASGRFEAVTFDVTIRELHDGVCDLPRHPIEGGTDLNDHVRRQPRTVTLEVGVTNTPIRVPISELTQEPISDVTGSLQGQSVQAVAQRIRRAAEIKGSPGLALPPVAGSNIVVGATPFKVDPAQWELEKSDQAIQVFVVEPMDRVRDVFDTLDGLFGQRLIVLTRLRQYNDMAIARVSAPVESPGYISFTIDLETFRTGETELVQPDPVDPRGALLQNNGAQAGYELPESQQSAMRQVQEAVQGFLQRDTVAAL